ETALAIHPDDAYDVLAINGASMSTQLSGLPFSGPVGATRIALVDGQWIAFPRYSELERAVFAMVVAGRVVTGADGTEDVAIAMIEAEATESAWSLGQDQGVDAPTEEVVAEGLEESKKFIRVLVEAQRELAGQAAKEVQDFPLFPDFADDVYAAVEEQAGQALADALTIAGKAEREERMDQVKDEMLHALAEQFEGREKELSAAYKELTKKLIRKRILTDSFRIDGRGLRDIRPLSAEVEVVPRVHGSALFERGETQI